VSVGRVQCGASELTVNDGETVEVSCSLAYSAVIWQVTLLAVSVGRVQCGASELTVNDGETVEVSCSLAYSAVIWQVTLSSCGVIDCPWLVYMAGDAP